MPIPVALKEENDVLSLLESIGMEECFNKRDSLGWIVLESGEGAMDFLYNAMESGNYNTFSGYLYHVNHVFNADFDSINFYWRHNTIEFEMENVHVPVRRCREVRVMIEQDYSILFYFQFGKGSCCAMRLSID